MTDTKWMMVCEFKAHEFNETQHYVDMGRIPADPVKISKAMSELGDWLFSHHYAETFPTPTYELKRSDDDTLVHLIRHKKPHMHVTVPADELRDLDDLAKAMAKAVEYIRKGAQRHFDL